jgi:hypothetical protein
MGLLGIFKKPLVAAIAAIAAGVIGLAFGLLFGWVIWPTQFTDATPEALSQTHQEDYLRLAIDSFGVRADPELAVIRWQNLGQDNAARAFKSIRQNPGKQDPGAILRFEQVIQNRVGSTLPTDPNAGIEEPPSSISKWVIYGAVGVVTLVILALAVYFGRRFLSVKQVAPEDYSPARQAQEIARTSEKTDFAKMGLQDPITRTMTTYVLGDDLYDESFSIDAPSGEFLGEYGVGISETIGVGESKKVTAIEIWLFDKNDIKTATKVLMSQHAFGDANIRQRLEAKGELVMLEPHGQVILETATLQLLATIVDLEYGQGNMPENSFFERITLELAIWPKA